jgi:hypothetical protein
VTFVLRQLSQVFYSEQARVGVLSDFFIADASSVPEYSGLSFPADERCQFKGITPLEAAGILAVLLGGGDQIAMMSEFRCLTPEDAEEWTQSVPSDMTSSLASLTESDLPGVARKCADITAEELGWTPAEFESVLTDLSALALRAIKCGKSMYLWNSL